MIGLSVSFCVREIAAGKVAIGDVEKIVAGTKADCPEAWEFVIARYKEVYWKGLEVLAEAVFRRLLAEGKIEQPFFTIGKTPNISGSHWVESESSIVYTE